jgi:CubicO group peptidase (beta-lactamase class C family)
MKRQATILAAILLTALPAAAWSATSSAAAQEQQIDALFQKWNKQDGPGAAIEVIRDGKVVLRKGYGMADVEHAAPNTPATAYHVASMSKQFTAFAIHLLEQDGKLSLDDDVRKYLPELPDYGKTITIRHLLQHTSGLRDQWNLLMMAGWRMDDVITDEDVFNLIRSQRELNFAPGAEHVYSNTGYTLMARIVKQVSGQSLAQFAKARIFEPLGMKHTFFHEQYGTLVPGRALSYAPVKDGGYRYMALSYSTVGPSSLFTTADDLALWDRNFYDARVGGKDLLAKMHRTGVLNSGKEINYASGLVVGKYRGLRSVEHGGADAGFRTQMLRFPEQHVSITVLANAADLNADALARNIADIYLEDQLAPRAAAPGKAQRTEVALSEAQLAPLVGEYELAPGVIASFTSEKGQLMTQLTGQQKFPMFATDERNFFLKVVDAQVSFDAPGADGVAGIATLHQNGRDMPMPRIVKTAAPSMPLAAFEGEYYSDELHVLYRIVQKGKGLAVSYPRGTIDFEAAGPNTFASFAGVIRFQCTADKECNTFTADNGRVRKLRFSKVAIVAAGAKATAPTGVFLTPQTLEKPEKPAPAAQPVKTAGL